jgi:uncharacterized iron-regulated membrane protein
MRQFLFKVHLWSGLTIGVLLVLLGISGSLLVFRGDIHRLQQPDWYRVAALASTRPVDDWVAAAVAAVPAKILARITLPIRSGDTALVYLQIPGARNLKAAELETVFVDPYRAKVLGSHVANSGVMWFLQDFHYALFAGETGLKVNGVAAIALSVLALSGPILWWPGWKRIRAGFKVRAQPTRARWRDLHAVSGIVCAAALLLIGLTGVYYAYRNTATAAVTLVSGNAVLPPPPAAAGDAVERLALQALVDLARRELPKARLDELRPARAAGSTASISFRMPGESVFGRNRVFVDPVSGDILRIDRYQQLPAASRFLANMQPWHFGNFGGRTTQWLWVLAGLLPGFLFGTGLWLWLRKSR